MTVPKGVISRTGAGILWSSRKLTSRSWPSQAASCFTALVQVRSTALPSSKRHSVLSSLACRSNPLS
jgi:hypothetical protein